MKQSEANSKSMPTIKFAAKLLRPKPESGKKAASWSFLIVPQKASDRLPSRGLVSVAGTMNGHEFAATLQPDGEGGHWLKVESKLSKAVGVEPGDRVEFVITPSTEEPEPEVPADVRKAINSDASSKAAWADITPKARRDWIHWITSGKKAETRIKRLATACDMLASGKRRPCCFDRSGMYSKSLSRPVAEDE